MTRVGRVRNRIHTQTGRVTRYQNGVLTSTSPNTLSRTLTMSDYIGRPISPKPMTATSWKGDGLYLDGTVNRTVAGVVYKSKFERYPLATGTGGIDTTPLAAPSGWMLSLVAGTNPSRPMLAPPTMIQDLVSIPSMIRQLGDLFFRKRGGLSPKDAANQYLLLQFGLLPLLEDLLKILDLQKHALKRARELEQLYQKGGLRRRLKFSDTTLVGNITDVNTTATHGSISSFGTVTCKKAVWGTIRWYPTSLPPYNQGDDSLNRLARRLVLGMTIEGMSKGIWDVIPWTWLLGWFTNIGKYLWAHSFTVPAQHSDGCLMSEARTTWLPGDTKYGPGVTGNVQMSGSLTQRKMTRVVGSYATPGFNMPFMDMFRLSIISSLFVQRFMK